MLLSHPLHHGHWSASPWSHLVGGCEAAGRWLHRATNLPSCHLPVCQTTCTQLYLDTISRRKFSHFLKMGKFTHRLVSSMHEPVSTQYHQRDVCCHHVGHLHRYADHHHQCQLLCERRRMSTEVFTGGAFYSSWSFLFTQRKVLPPHRTPITQCDISGHQRTQNYKYSNVFTDMKTLFLVKSFYLEKI